MLPSLEKVPWNDCCCTDLRRSICLVHTGLKIEILHKQKTWFWKFYGRCRHMVIVARWCYCCLDFKCLCPPKSALIMFTLIHQWLKNLDGWSAHLALTKGSNSCYSCLMMYHLSDFVIQSHRWKVMIWNIFDVSFSSLYLWSCRTNVLCIQAIHVLLFHV